MHRRVFLSLLLLASVFAGGDNAVDAIAAHPTDPDVVYLGMEGRVMKSEDGGLYVATSNGVYRHVQSTRRTRSSWCARTGWCGNEAERSHVVAARRIVDVRGRRVATLAEAFLDPGRHRFTFDAGGLRAGVYFGRLQARGRFSTVRLLRLE
jgi:hypothetical protein